MRGFDVASASCPQEPWQPIETAPKDGTEILAFAHRDRAYYGVAQWAEANEALGSVAGWFWPYATRPTHWMRLPEPPIATQGTAS